ncbi:hypothetical protein ACQ86N_01825 [Puia sp. P3]|uniref:hypothetical protein n=1 Tax=Puia sp. P3 TaxID=3423952 RepID=UPI003D6788B3
MLKHIDYLYFNIYSYFYRSSQYRQVFNPRLQAMYLFSLGLGGWLLFFESMYLHFWRHSRFESKMQSSIFAGMIYMLTAAFFNYVFIIRDRDQKIFGKYETLVDGHKRRKLHLVLSLSVLLLPYALMTVLAVMFPRH